MTAPWVVLVLGEIVLGTAPGPPPPSPAALAAHGLAVLDAGQTEALVERFAEWEPILIASLAPGRGLQEDVIAVCRERGAIGPLREVLRQWTTTSPLAPSPRAGVRLWGPPAVVDSLLKEDRERAASWLGELPAAKGETTGDVAPAATPPALEPAFTVAPCSAPADPTRGAVAGVTRGVGGEPMRACGIYAPALGVAAVSDDEGRFVLCDLPPGPLEMQVVHATSRDVRATVPVRPGKVTKAEVLLFVPPAARSE